MESKGETLDLCVSNLPEDVEMEECRFTEVEPDQCPQCDGDGFFGPPDDRYDCGLCDMTGHTYDKQAEDPKNVKYWG